VAILTGGKRVGSELIVVAEGERDALRLVIVAAGKMVALIDVVVELEALLVARLKVERGGDQVVAARGQGGWRWAGAAR
jgi:hypothetical protein